MASTILLCNDRRKVAISRGEEMMRMAAAIAAMTALHHRAMQWGKK